MVIRSMIVFVSEPGIKHVHGDIIRSFSVDWVTINNDSELVIFLVQLYTSDAVRNFAKIDSLA